MAALAASTSRRAGMAVKVARTIPVVYSAATERTPRAPRMTTATHIPVSEVLVGSNAWRCWALMVAHELAWTAVARAEKPMAATTVMATVRHVEGRVRSLVHSALTARRVAVARTERTGELG